MTEDDLKEGKLDESEEEDDEEETDDLPISADDLWE